MASRQTAFRLLVWLLVVMLVVAVLAGLSLGLRSADARSRLDRFQRSLGEDRLALDHAFLRGSLALERAAREFATGAQPESLLDEMFKPDHNDPVAAVFHDASGAPVSGRPVSRPDYLQQLHPDLLPTSRPLVSPPYRPEFGALAVAVVLPVPSSKSQ